MKKIRISPALIAAALAFLGAWGFFWFVYPYHLLRREQMNLFAFDADYISQTYRGSAWLARFAGDFLEQFFLFPGVGALIVALLLTGIGVVVYRICRKFLGKWPSLGIAFLFFAWSFLRETGNLYITRYTVATLAYLSLVLLALQFRKAWLRPVAGVLLVAFGVWALGSPYHKHYGKAWGVPLVEYDRVIGLDTEISRENWDKVVRLSKKDLHMVESSYCYNLAYAMTGKLGDALFNYVQNHQYTLLIPVSIDNSLFTNMLAGEAWFQLGDMTVAEQSAVTALQASPKHTGVRFLVRLARVNLITGEYAAAQKYLDLLRWTLFYGKWARSMMPGRQDEATRAQLAEARERLLDKDLVHHSDKPGTILLDLLEKDPDNQVAREYLLCLDLLRYDLEQFMEDYTPHMIPGRIYQEAVLIWLSRNGTISEERVAAYGIDASLVDKMIRFSRNPGAYKNTYWYYYLQAMNAN